MKKSIHPYRRAQVFFGVVFLLSAGFLSLATGGLFSKSPGTTPAAIATYPAQPGVVSPAPSISPGETRAPQPSPTPRPSPAPGALDGNGFFLTVGLPVFSAALSLLGFVSTTFLGWRRERRDSRFAALEIERQQLELARTRLELERLRGEGKTGNS